MDWTYSPLAQGGEKWTLCEVGHLVATVVRMPGTQIRTFHHRDGETTDHPTFYLAHAELRRRLGRDDVPPLTNVSDRLHRAGA